MKNEERNQLMQASSDITDFARSISFTIEKRTEVHGDLIMLTRDNLNLIKSALEVIAERSIWIRFLLSQGEEKDAT